MWPKSCISKQLFFFYTDSLEEGSFFLGQKDPTALKKHKLKCREVCTAMKFTVVLTRNHSSHSTKMYWIIVQGTKKRQGSPPQPVSAQDLLDALQRWCTTPPALTFFTSKPTNESGVSGHTSKPSHEACEFLTHHHPPARVLHTRSLTPASR